MQMHLPGRHRFPLVGAVIATVVAGLTVIAPIAHAATPVRDGSTAELAAASCWEVKQVNPAATDGVYWLQTPALVAPAQFYCDQTTDGGGWVLIGRGREDWNFLYTGQGTASDIANTPSGTAAFTPAALPSTTVDGLLNGGRPDALSDGVRLVRSESTDGSVSQEVRFTFSSRDRWDWTIPASHPLGTWSMTRTGLLNLFTATGSGGNSQSFGSDQTYARVGTLGTKAESYENGWAFGTSASGSTSSTSYVWKSATSGSRAVPFTQVYLRPKLLQSNLTYPTIADTGATAQALPDLPQTTVLTNPWGVGGAANGNAGLDDTEVRAIAQAGNRMIVGGNFAYVEQDASGTGKVNQQYLAAFDVATGAWLSDFRPTFNNQVQRIVYLPNGDIAVGGDFTTVNGVSSPGLAILNPTTGQIDPNFRIALQQQMSGADFYVRGLALSGGYLYIGGNFSHISAGTNTTFYYSRALARVNVATDTVDTNWRPVVLGNINAISGSQDGTRVYVVGNYSTIQGITTEPYFSALSTAAGAAIIPGLNPQFSSPSGKKYQQAVTEAGSRVWEGGSEHMMFTYNISDLSLASTNIAYNHGDFQILTAHNGVVYGSCHCSQWLYSGASSWPSPSGWNEADSLEYIGAWDVSTGKYIPSFVPDGVEDRAEYGAWALTFDSNGTLWAGGDFISARGSSGTRVWTGAFMRFAAQDSTPPSTPTGLKASTTSTGGLRLSWTASTDNSTKAIRYEVLENDRVVANVGGATSVLTMPSTSTRYFVRAIDAAGNRSASTPVLTYP